MRILHMFNWNLNDIIPELSTIADQGFDAVQINPIQPLKETGVGLWWLSYQPCGFRIGNQYGSKEDLIRLCNEARKNNISIISDVVCNHTANRDDGSLNPHEKVDDILKNNPYFWKEARNVYNWKDRYEVTHYSMGLPGLQLSNYDLQDIIINFLNELIDCGVGGFRFDAAKSIGLPREGCDFWPRVMSNLKSQDLFNYGEVIFESSSLINEYCQYMNVLTDSRNNSKDRTVVFAESHDTYLEFGYTKSKSPDQINYEYSMLARDYPNTLYYSRPFDNSWKQEMVRKANNCNIDIYTKAYSYKIAV